MRNKPRLLGPLDSCLLCLVGNLALIIVYISTSSKRIWHLQKSSWTLILIIYILT